ncbi:hypothetical protein [Persephonella sp.]|uniref:hypothetical protein n=1 Tax=Persephonella sp. TaxID=2060922 RepID=UPI00260F0207|nr:hypothetical protein [Persephonella sp.]
MKKLLISLFLFSFVYGLEIDYGFLKLKVVQLYPAKEYFYEKEPVFVRFDIYVIENKTALKKEVLLSYLRIKPVEPKIIKYQQKYSIHPEEKKLTIKNLLYLKTGNTDLPFALSFNTERMKGLLEENFLKKLSRKYILKSQHEYPIKQSPYRFIGDFDIKPRLIDENGVATLLIEISGKGFPAVPDYTLAVRNGSAKKISTDIQDEMGYITAVEKFKIVYMDGLQVLPIKFKYFDPFQEKIITKETKPIEIKKSTRSQKIPFEKLSQEEKNRIYLETFKQLYPEYFKEKNPLKDFMQTLNKYREAIALFVLFSGLIFALFVKKVAIRRLDLQILQIISLPENSLKTMKKLYRYMYPQQELFKDYLKTIEELLYSGKLVIKDKKIVKLITPSGEFSPKEIRDIIQNLKFQLVNEKAKVLSKNANRVIKIWIFIERHKALLTSAGFVLFATAVVQLFAKLYPQQKFYLNILNMLILVAGIFIYILMKQVIIKVENDRV